MRAREPDARGTVTVDGLAVGWERTGTGDPAILFTCATPIVESRMWKAQVPWLARRHTVVTFDPRGNGASDRPVAPELLEESRFVDDCLAVLDAAGVQRAVVVGLCSSAAVALLLAADHPERVHGVVAINPGLAVTTRHPFRATAEAFEGPPVDGEGWVRENAARWREDWLGFASFFFHELLPEPHSSKAHEDCVHWAAGTSAATMIASARAGPEPHTTLEGAEALCRRVTCPVLVLNGDQDRCQPPARSRRVAELTGADLVVLAGCGHLPNARDPVRVNLEIARFADRFRRAS